MVMNVKLKNDREGYEVLLFPIFLGGLGAQSKTQ
jgi:hypothetical protein